MHFAFTDEQRELAAGVRAVLDRACPPRAVRGAWESGRGRAPELWGVLAEVGVLGARVPEDRGGLGASELDTVLVFEEAGRAAVPEPLIDTAWVAAPLLAEHGDAALTAPWLERIAAGDAVVCYAREGARVPWADAADLFVVDRGDAIVAVEKNGARVTPRPTVDGGRPLFDVEVDAAAGDPAVLAEGAAARAAAARAFDRGAVAAAAVLAGLARRMIDMAVTHATTRHQFGRPIGSFQAVKHHLAEALVAVELARPAVYRAAVALAAGEPDRAVHASTAKALASDAAQLAARKALQCHGAIGYSFEYDLHLWMKRAWALAAAWGGAAWHRERVARHILDDEPTDTETPCPKRS